MTTGNVVSTRKACAVVAAFAAKEQLLAHHAQNAPLSWADRSDIEREYAQAVRSERAPTIERATRMFRGGLALARIWGARAAAIRSAAVRVLTVVDHRAADLVALVGRDRVVNSPTLPPTTAVSALSLSTMTAAPPSSRSSQHPAGAVA